MRSTRTIARIAGVFAAFAAFAAFAPLGAQSMQDISTEYRPARNETFVRMKKLALDNENQIGAFYAYSGHTQQTPANEVTVHVVHSGAAWAYAMGYNVVVVLDGNTRVPLPRAQRAASVGDGYVLEQLFIAVPRQQAAQIAQAHKVEMKVGDRAFTWSDSLQHAFSEIAASAGAGAGAR